MDALKLLDEDCWEEILDRVEDPKDLKSCNEVCLTFQQILRTKKNAFMSGLILPHILKYLTSDYQQYKPFFDCRLICKSWCNSLDKLLDNVGIFVRAFSFNSGERTDQFLQKFATHNGNPFRGRRVNLHLRSPPLLAQIQTEGLNEFEGPANFYMRKLHQLLERFGNKICNVLLGANNNDHLAFSKNIQTVLGHLSNLRTLRLEAGDRYDLTFELDQQEDTAELTHYIEANPLPALPLLDDLDALGVNGMMMQRILQKCTSNLTSLTVDDSSGFPEQGLHLYNLKRLTLARLDVSTSLHGLRQLQAPQLKLLSLEVTQNRNQLEVCPIDEHFQNIQHLPIQILHIGVSGENVFVGESGAASAEQRPYHDTIETINLYFPSGSVSLNFLLYCPKLKYLFRFRPFRPQGVPARVAGHPYSVTELLDINELVEQATYDVYQSNIWENIPYLKTFQFNYIDSDINFREEKYKRTEYERRKLENGGEGAMEDNSFPESE